MIVWKELLREGVKFLSENNIDDAQFDAYQLILSFFDGNAADYMLHFNDEVPAECEENYRELIVRRSENEPLQYILGKWDFYNSSFVVGSGVLIPRPETEELVDRSISLIRKNSFKTVYDLCSGSGCIGLSIAKECPDVQCFLFELYDDALFYTEKNTQLLSLSNVKIIKHDVLSGYPENIPCADMIISNPPYIESYLIPELQTEVLREPLTALDGGDDGLIFYRTFFEKWTDKLKVNGYFAFECAENQTDAIADLAGSCYINTKYKDIYGNDRFVFSLKIKEGI